jgi:hypothetical protein
MGEHTHEAELLERLMEEANVNYAQRDEFRADPPRACALLEHALRRRAVKAPAAYALARFRRGEWPSARGGRSRPSTAYERVSKMIHGYGWDESYGRGEMLEEIEAIYQRRGERLRDPDRERLVSLWEAESLRRYPPTPLTAEEWAAIGQLPLDANDQLELA